MLRNGVVLPLPSRGPSAAAWLPRVMTLLVWVLAAASVGYWALRLMGPTERSDTAAVANTTLAQPDATTVARVLGATPVGVAAAPMAQPAGRLVLVGVVADRRQGGAALIAIDGKPPRPYRVGARVDQDLLLQAVAPRRAVLAARMDAAPSLTLELPPLNGRL